MIAGGHQTGVDVLAGDKLAEIGIRLAILILVLFVDEVLLLLENIALDITDGDHLGVGIAQEGTHHRGTARANTDTADRDPVVGRDLPVFAKSGGGYNPRGAASGDEGAGRSLEKRTP